MVKHKHGSGGAPSHGHGSATAAVPGKQTLTQSLGMTPVDPSAAIYKDEATRLTEAGRNLQHDVTRWNIGLDVLSAGMVRNAGEQAMSDFLLVLQNATALESSGMADRAREALAAARDLVAQLGLFHFHEQPITAREVTLEDTTALPHIQRSIERAERCIADALRLFDLCQGGKTAGVQLDPSARLQIGAILDKHADNDEEARWLQAFVKGTNIGHTIYSMGTDSAAEDLAMRTVQVQADEQYFATKRNGRDFDAAEMAAMDTDAASIEDFIAKDAYGWRTIDVLKKYTPDKRLYLVQLLNHRHQLENMVHRAGMYGDEVQSLIRECPGLDSWEYEYKNVTAKSTSDEIDDSVSEMASELPGAALELAGGVYHEMGHLPAIGPVFERAGKSFDDLAAVTDDAIGVNKDDVAMRNEIAGATGHVVGAMGMSAVGGVVEAKRGADVVKAGMTAADVLNEIRDGFAKAQEAWGTVTAIATEVSSGIAEYQTDALAGDPDKWHHVIDHLDAVLDVAIDKLGEMEGAAMGGAEGKLKDAAAKQDAEDREHEIDRAGEAAMSQDLKDEHAAADEAARRYATARSPKKRAAYKADLDAHVAKVKELGARDALRIATAKQLAERDQDEKASQAAQRQAALEKAGDKVGYYKDKLGDVLEEIVVGFTVGALRGAKKELKKAADRLLDGKDAGLDVRQIMISAIAGGATEATIGLVMPKAKKMLTAFFVNAIGDVLAAIDSDLRGASSLAEGAIDEAVDWGLEKLGVQDKLEEAITELVERAFGGNESLAGGGGEEVSGE